MASVCRNKHRLAITSMTLLLAACATVLSNDGNTVVIDWDPSASEKDAAQRAADRSCAEVGKRDAVEVADVSANPSLPAWMTKRRVTYRCE